MFQYVFCFLKIRIDLFYFSVKRRQCIKVETTHLMQYSYCLLVNLYRKQRNFDVVGKRMTSRRQLNNVIFYGRRAQVIENSILFFEQYLRILT